MDTDGLLFFIYCGIMAVVLILIIEDLMIRFKIGGYKDDI